MRTSNLSFVPDSDSVMITFGVGRVNISVPKLIFLSQELIFLYKKQYKLHRNRLGKDSSFLSIHLHKHFLFDFDFFFPCVITLLGLNPHNNCCRQVDPCQLCDRSTQRGQYKSLSQIDQLNGQLQQLAIEPSSREKGYDQD